MPKVHAGVEAVSPFDKHVVDNTGKMQYNYYIETNINEEL